MPDTFKRHPAFFQIGLFHKKQNYLPRPPQNQELAVFVFFPRFQEAHNNYKLVNLLMHCSILSVSSFV